MVLSFKRLLKEKDHLLFNGLVVYYWLVFSFINYAADPNDINAYEGTGYRYYLLIIPLMFYILLNIKVFLKLKFEKNIMWIILYTVIVSAFSLSRMDLKTIMNASALALPLMIVATIRPAVNIKLINMLFLLSIVIVIILHQDGLSKYGYLPGQTTGNLHQGLWWRISIWEHCTPPFSAAFAIIVIIANFFYNPRRSRYLFYMLGIYFIIFSGSRTALVIIFISGIFLLVTRVVALKSCSLFKTFPVISLLLFYCMVIFPIIIAFVSIENEFLKSFVFRQAEGYEELQEQTVRPVMMYSQMKIFVDSYALGVGTDNLNNKYKSLTAGTSAERTVGSDAFMTYLMARDGIAFIFLVFFFAGMFSEAMKRNDIIMYLMILIIMLYATSYGGFLNFMNPVFLMLWGLLYSGCNRRIIGRGGAGSCRQST